TRIYAQLADRMAKRGVSAGFERVEHKLRAFAPGYLLTPARFAASRQARKRAKNRLPPGGRAGGRVSAVGQGALADTRNRLLLEALHLDPDFGGVQLTAAHIVIVHDHAVGLAQQIRERRLLTGFHLARLRADTFAFDLRLCVNPEDLRRRAGLNGE